MRCKNVICLMILLFAVISCENGIVESNGTTTTTDKDAFRYTVIFNANGGHGSMSGIIMTYNKAVNLPECIFTRDGYTFGGWNTKSDGSGTDYYDKASVINLTSEKGTTVTLYAKWTPITYTVIFNANSGSGSMSSISMTYDVSQNLPECTLTRDGYTFGGWNAEQDGSGTNYADKASVLNLTSEEGAIVTLYAVWDKLGEISQITITAPIYNEIDGLLAYSNGTFTAKDGCASYSWYIDGRQQDETGRTFTPDKESIDAGVHSVSVKVYCEGRWYSASCDIRVQKKY